MEGYIVGVWLLLPAAHPWSVGISTAPSIQRLRLFRCFGQRTKRECGPPLREEVHLNLEEAVEREDKGALGVSVVNPC